MTSRSRRWLGIVGVCGLVVLVLAVLVAVVVPASTALAGPADGTVLGASAANGVVFTIPGVSGAPDQAAAVLDGAPVAATLTGDRFSVALAPLAEGTHRLTVTLPARFPFLPAPTFTRTFTVDLTPPVVTIATPLAASSLHEAVTVTGSAGDAVALRVGEQQVALRDGGDFTFTMPSPPPTVHVRATDRAGNTTDLEVPVAVVHPPMRAVHMTALAWSSATLREPVLALLREHRIDAVELDIKDESGEVGYDSQVPLARQIGAAKGYYDARQAIEALHSLGARVVGRLVAFHDPVLAQAQWQAGNRDAVAQTAAGAPWTGGYGAFAFTNFANPDVRRYNIDLAAEAAALGFDDILYDYVRRPDGAIGAMRFPGLVGDPSLAIASFLHDARQAVRAHGAFLGASVFGISATRPEQIAQNIPEIAREVDYISPMVYPSHWNAGEYGVADPDGQPFDITQRSLASFQSLVGGSTTKIIPWLQAFSLRHTYGPAEVVAQVAASRADGVDSFLLWNAGCRYDATALPAG